MSTDSTKSPGTGPNQIPDRAIVTDDNPVGDPMAFYRDRFQIMQTFWSNVHAEGLKDDKFVAGDHWEEVIRKERQEDRRPVLTYNLLPAFTRQITNRIRQERPTVKVTPVETSLGADPRMKNIAGTRDYGMAEIYAGIIKNIEHVSRADQAYDTATKHAVDHGFGYFYLVPQWSKIDPFVQELRIHRVKNSYGVYMDPDAQEADYRDMQDAFMFTMMQRDTFKHKYPEAALSEWAPVALGASYEGWYDPDNIRIAQYFFLEHRQDEALMLSNGKIVYRNDVEDVLDDLERETGIHVQKNDQGQEMRRQVKRPICMWQKMTADEILEGPIELPFSAVPIFPVLGEEVFADGKTRYESAIRHARDPQKSYNYWRTAAVETVALAPRAPWMLTERQISGHEELYENANTRNLPYLLYNHQEGVAIPQRVFPSQVAAAELQNATQDGVDMQTIIGLHDASLGRESNEKSGRAIIARQNAGATATFQFPDNLGRALEQCGRCIVEAIPKLYDTKRQVRIRLPDQNEDFIEINREVRDSKTGNSVLMHDIAYGKYDVTLETGPSYATQRQEAADLQMELLKILGPDMARNIVHLIVQNLGVPGSEEVAAVLRKMLPEALKTEEEKMADLPAGVKKDPETGQLVDGDGQPWQPPPTLEQQIAMKQQELDQAEHNAELAKHKATSDKAAADKAEAELELERLRQQQAQGQVEEGEREDQLPAIQEIIQQTMREHEQNQNAHQAMNIEDQIADAIVDALQRVRGYVDRQVKAGKMTRADADAIVDHAQPQASSSPRSQEVEVDVNLNLDKKPDSIEHEYDGAGNIVRSVPKYNGSGEAAEE